jgi:hypothetical protein
MLVPLTTDPAWGADPPAGAAVPCTGVPWPKPPVCGVVWDVVHPAKAAAITITRIIPALNPVIFNVIPPPLSVFTGRLPSIGETDRERCKDFLSPIKP